MRSVALSLVAVLSVGGGVALAQARPVGGSPVQVRLHGRLSPAIGLRPQKGAWSLRLAGCEGGAELEFTDVTAGVTPESWTIAAAKDRVQLDPERFAPGHTYRLLVRRVNGGVSTETFYVYLFPGKGEKAGAAHVTFTDEPAPDGDDVEIATLPKGAL